MSLDKIVYFNFIPVSAGGGLQNALSFIFSLDESPPSFRYSCLVVEGSEAFFLCKKLAIPFRSVKQGRISRFFFEVAGSFFLVRPGSVIFTLFGPPPIAASLFSRCINGCAYSNLLYPELDFWKGRRLYRIKKALVDLYRRLSFLFSGVIIFETEVLASRARASWVFKNKKICTVKMAPSNLVRKEFIDNAVASSFAQKIGCREKIKILYLSGAHSNKRHLDFLKILGFANAESDSFRLITTLPEGAYLEALRNSSIDGSLINVGPVKQADVASLISVVDSMVNVSLLESFSNNFVEAWEMGKPLIVTDADWARGACGAAALYIDPTLHKDSSMKLVEFFKSIDMSFLEVKAAKQLASLPSRGQRYQQYLKIIDEEIAK